MAWRFLSAKGSPFEKKQLFFMPKQRELYHALTSAVGDDYAIFANVTAASVLRPHPSLKGKKRQPYVQKLEAIPLPFVLCDHEKLSVVAAIAFELEEREQENAKLVEQHEALVHACEAAGATLMLFPAKPPYAAHDVSVLVAEYLNISKSTLVSNLLEDFDESFDVPQEAEIEPLVVDLDLSPLDNNEDMTTSSQEPLCPKCGAPMVHKKAEKGRRAGKYFLMCSTFPACKRAIPLEQDDTSELRPPMIPA